MLKGTARSLFLVLIVILACGTLGAVFGQHLTGDNQQSDNAIRDNL